VTNNEASLSEWFETLIPYRWHLRLALSVAVLLGIFCLASAAKQVEFFAATFNDTTVPSELPDNSKMDPIAKPAMSLSSARNLFGKYQATPSTVTDSDLQLNGVIMSDDPTDRVAIIAEKRKPEEIYRLNDKLPGGAILKEVHTDHVIISINSRLETLMLNLESSGVSTTSSKTRKRPSTKSQDYKKYQKEDFEKYRMEDIQERIKGGGYSGGRGFPGGGRMGIGGGFPNLQNLEDLGEKYQKLMEEGGADLQNMDPEEVQEYFQKLMEEAQQ